MVYGSESLGKTLGQDQEGLIKEIHASAGKVVYEKHTDRWYVLSATEKGQTLYQKVFKSGGQFKTIRLAYPFGNQEMNAITQRMSGCFKDDAKKH